MKIAWVALMLFAALVMFGAPSLADPIPAYPGTVSDYHGYTCHNFTVDGCSAMVVEPHEVAAGRPWIWRAMFWDAFPGADVMLLGKGFHLAYIEVGNTFGCPDAMRHWDPFYALLTGTYQLSRRPALEGVSRGGLYVYRWAAEHVDQVGCIYGDAPVCDFKSWPGGKGKGSGSAGDWVELIKDYHFASEAEALAFKGNPVDLEILRPLAKARIPLFHVVGDADVDVPETENTDIVRERYLKLGGSFVLFVKRGGTHHPHGLADPTPLVNLIVEQGAAPARGHKRPPAPHNAVTYIPAGT